MTTLINHWIGGRTVDTQPERTGAVYDPATGQQAAQVAYATGEDVDAAVRAAQAAYPAWRDTSAPAPAASTTPGIAPAAGRIMHDRHAALS